MKTLSLQGCPEVNDWFLARLHIFQDSLEELDISHCPCITIGGLPALRNLKYVYNIQYIISTYIYTYIQYLSIIVTTLGMISAVNLIYFYLVCYRRLRRLDVSSLPRVSNPGLVFILLEEMLPHCHITATGYNFSLRQESKEGSKEQFQGQG